MNSRTKTRVFMSGRSQHVTIPLAFRFKSSEVSIRRDERTGEIILTEIEPLSAIFAELDAAGLPENFLLGESRGIDREIGGKEDA